MFAVPEATDGRLRVLVVDDKVMPRIAAKAMLSSSKVFRFAGEASSGPEGVRLCEVLKPDIVLLDVEMPLVDGATTAKLIRELGGPTPTIVAWTVSESGDDLIRMMRAGCAGYVLKDAGPEELRRALEAAVRGESPVPRRLIPQVLARAVAAPAQEEEGEGAELSARELEVLRMVARGQATKEMAQKLGLSRHSVDTHLANLYRKLGVAGRGQAVALALRRGLLGTDDF